MIDIVARWNQLYADASAARGVSSQVSRSRFTVSRQLSRSVEGAGSGLAGLRALRQTLRQRALLEAPAAAEQCDLRTRLSRQTGASRGSADLQQRAGIWREAQRLRERQVVQALMSRSRSRVPEHVGPLNPQHLAMQTLERLHSLSPVYMRHYLTLLQAVHALRAIR